MVDEQILAQSSASSPRLLHDPPPFLTLAARGYEGGLPRSGYGNLAPPPGFPLDENGTRGGFGRVSTVLDAILLVLSLLSCLGICNFTSMGLPFKRRRPRRSSETTCRATSDSSKVTKPKPRLRFVTWSTITRVSTTVPNFSKKLRNSASVTTHGVVAKRTTI